MELISNISEAMEMLESFQKGVGYTFQENVKDDFAVNSCRS